MLHLGSVLHAPASLSHVRDGTWSAVAWQEGCDICWHVVEMNFVRRLEKVKNIEQERT